MNSGKLTQLLFSFQSFGPYSFIIRVRADLLTEVSLPMNLFLYGESRLYSGSRTKRNLK